MKSKQYYVYILTNRKDGVLYIGSTSVLMKRVAEHKIGFFGGFTKKYNIHRLVYYEIFNDPKNAIKREKRLKKWKRAWKIQLIEKENPK